MNRIRKFDLYLLERFPLLWHTKICYMLLYSVLLSAVFYLWGFFYTNQYHINNRPVNLYFSDSYATFFLVIFFIIGITFWALSYFKKSAVKNFYPLQRFYFTKLFLNFILIFWSLTWPSKTFNWGVNQKVKTLASLEELQQAIKTINTAHAFLPESSSDYEAKHFLATKYPNVEWVRFNKTDSIWNDDGISLLESTRNGFRDYIPEEHPEATNNIEGVTIQLLQTKKEAMIDTCNQGYHTVVTKSLKYKDLTSNKFYDLRNYEKELISSDHFDFPEYDLFQSYWAQIHNRYGNRYYEYYYDDFQSVKPEINKQVNELLDKDSPKAISEVVNQYQHFLKKYGIHHYLEPDTILNYLAKHPNAISQKTIVSVNGWGIESKRLRRNRFPSFEAYQQYRNNKDLDNDYLPAYFVDRDQVKQLYRNVYDANFPYIDWEYLFVILIISTALSFVFILFSFSDLLTLLLAIPFGGILLVLNILCIVFLTSFGIHENFDTKISIHVILFMTLMYGLLFWFDQSKKVHKRILNITFYLCFLLTAFLPHALLFLIDNLFKKDLISSCGNEYTQHTVFFYWLPDPLLSLLLPVAFMLLFMKFIRPVISKAD